MSQNRRQDSINGFRNGKYDVLVATDIAARVIDVNCDMPDSVDTYTNRIGRTAPPEKRRIVYLRGTGR